MREITITKRDEGQRLDKYLKKYLSEAPGSFIYKMLRKKNITLNDKKADGSEKIEENDVIKMFLAEETLDKFSPSISSSSVSNSKSASGKVANVQANVERQIAGNNSAHSENKVKENVKIKDFNEQWLLYQDEDMIFVNKPSGMLSQKARPEDRSMNEIMIDYLLNNGTIAMEELKTFKPSICNRLDRNTSGILSFGKTMKGTQYLTEGFRERTFGKYYLCVVKGVIKDRATVEGYLIKNEKTNKVTVLKEYNLGNSSLKKQNTIDAEYIKTEYIPIVSNGKETFLKIKLHTGKTHQIRAHLASIGHPLAGDYKYGNVHWNDELKKQYGIKDQLLHAFELNLEDRRLHIVAPMPKLMCQFLKGEQLWEPGNQGDLEALH